jgi:adenosylcobinamide-phosphate synthase
MYFSTVWYVLPLAFALDLFIGDPQCPHHPVRYMGRAIERLEPRFRNMPFPLIFSGGLFSVSLVLALWSLGSLTLILFQWISPTAKNVLEILLVYFCISFRALEKAAMEIYGILLAGSSNAAREKLSRIVGRDVQHLSEKEIARATVETVAENLVDGFISPLFFFAVGGVPLMMAYKMVNTLDSMVGYKNEEYQEFGRVSARLDDGANFFPARISIPVIALAARILTGKGREAFQTAVLEGKNHTSPNSGIPEAAFAGALHVKLGGPSQYQGRLVEKPYIGAAFSDVEMRHIPKACDLMVLSSFLWMVIIWAVSMLLGLLV